MFKYFAGMALLVAVFSFACGGGDGADSPEPDPTKDSSTAKATPSAAQLLDIVQLPVSGFTAADPRSTPFGATVVYTSEAKTAGGAEIQVLVTVAACDVFICATLDPGEYSSTEAQRNLKSTLSTAHIENPDLVWEFGEFDLSSSSAGLFTFALSYLESKDSSGGTTRLSANAFRTWYNDGGTFISMDVYSRGAGSTRSVEDLEKAMSKSEAESAAKAVFSVLSAKFTAK